MPWLALNTPALSALAAFADKDVYATSRAMSLASLAQISTDKVQQVDVKRTLNDMSLGNDPDDAMADFRLIAGVDIPLPNMALTLVRLSYALVTLGLMPGLTEKQQPIDSIRRGFRELYTLQLKSTIRPAFKFALLSPDEIMKPANAEKLAKDAEVAHKKAYDDIGLDAASRNVEYAKRTQRRFDSTRIESAAKSVLFAMMARGARAVSAFWKTQCENIKLKLSPGDPNIADFDPSIAVPKMWSVISPMPSWLADIKTMDLQTIPSFDEIKGPLMTLQDLREMVNALSGSSEWRGLESSAVYYALLPRAQFIQDVIMPFIPSSDFRGVIRKIFMKPTTSIFAATKTIGDDAWYFSSCMKGTFPGRRKLLSLVRLHCSTIDMRSVYTRLRELDNTFKPLSELFKERTTWEGWYDRDTSYTLDAKISIPFKISKYAQPSGPIATADAAVIMNASFWFKNQKRFLENRYPSVDMPKFVNITGSFEIEFLIDVANSKAYDIMDKTRRDMTTWAVTTLSARPELAYADAFVAPGTQPPPQPPPTQPPPPLVEESPRF
jgi:hypothetical protein